MPDTYRQHARDLLHQAANAHDPRRQKYLAGLASSYEALARQHGEPKPARADRADRLVALQAQGLSQAAIAKEFGVSPQRISEILRQVARADRR